MCGGHAIHHLIGSVTTKTGEVARSKSYLARAGSDSADVENEVKLMYARGEIGAEIFRHLIATAEAGELRVQDLQMFQIRHADNNSVKTELSVWSDESTVGFNHHLQTQREYLKAACAETEESVRCLQLEAALLYQEAEYPDTSLKMKTHTLSRARSVEQRIEVIQERLVHLKAQLADVVTQQCLLEGSRPS